ncbi:hypothetical protein K8T06_09585 [bacterium]|nr:hypothetical protein [bacterium]
MRISDKNKLKKLAKSFPEWNEIRGDYLCWENLGDKASPDDDCYMQFWEIQKTILMFWMGSQKPSQCGWDEISFLPLHNGQSAMVDSSILQTSFRLNYFDFELTLETDIPFVDCIKYAKDTFWQRIASLGQYGKFSFFESSLISKELAPVHAKPFLKLHQSHFFSFIRNTMFMELFQEELGQPYLDDLGSFQLRWSIDNDWEKILVNGYEAFNNFCLAFRELSKIAARRHLI